MDFWKLSRLQNGIEHLGTISQKRDRLLEMSHFCRLDIGPLGRAFRNSCQRFEEDVTLVKVLILEMSQFYWFSGYSTPKCVTCHTRKGFKTRKLRFGCCSCFVSHFHWLQELGWFGVWKLCHNCKGYSGSMSHFHWCFCYLTFKSLTCQIIKGFKIKIRSLKPVSQL